MGYYAKFYSVMFDPNEDYSYMPPWMELLERLDDLCDRREELTAQGGGCRNIAFGWTVTDPQIRFSDSDIRFALPDELNWVEDIDRAIAIAKKDLIEDWGINVDLIVEPIPDLIPGQIELPLAV